MLGKIYRLGILAALSLFLLLGTVLVASSYSKVGMMYQVGAGGVPLQLHDYSDIPQSVREDATGVARSLLGDSPERIREFVRQMLALYAEVRDQDFLIVFSPGGWGERWLEDAPGWQSIIAGIQSELNSLGYKWVSLDYTRTDGSWGGRLAEMGEMAELYPAKARYLASRIDFLTRNIPRLRVILTGESTGAVILDIVMTILEGNQQVYSIVTGPPFWHKTASRDRVLVLTNSGLIPDAFSRGDFLAIIRDNLRVLFRLPPPVESGTVFNSIRAPGHTYWWQYPDVYSNVIRFLEQNFGTKVRSF